MRNKMKGIKQLCKQVEQTANITVSTPNDFEWLSGIIFQQLRTSVSVSTLKRLWGYAGQEANPRRNTLDILAKFVGYKNYEAFESAFNDNNEPQSQMFLADAISAEDLDDGDRLQLTWLPDRRCVVTHLGNGRFRVDEAENSKLSVGDTFECHLFINHEPLFLDKVIRQNQQSPLYYVAGQRNGVIIRKL